VVDEPGNSMTDMPPKSRLKKALRTPAPVRPLKERATFGRCDVSQGVGDRQALGHPRCHSGSPRRSGQTGPAVGTGCNPRIGYTTYRAPRSDTIQEVKS
jgi:hypothetical protein